MINAARGGLFFRTIHCMEERLQKILAHAGTGSRRQCEMLILRGHVAIDGRVVRELGTKVDPDQQQVAVDGVPIRHERLAYWVVNKPRGYLCTNHDPGRRPLALDLIPHVPQRVYCVGRLDETSEGLLLLTNDGELAYRLMHPRFSVEKSYLVQVAGRPSLDDVHKLLRGVWLSDGHVKAKRVKRLKSQGDSTWMQVVLAEGRNREIRRMLARLGHKVMQLKRVALGPIKLGRLKKGKSRPLTASEIQALRHTAERAPRPEAEEAQRPKRPFRHARGKFAAAGKGRPRKAPHS